MPPRKNMPDFYVRLLLLRPTVIPPKGALEAAIHLAACNLVGNDGKSAFVSQGNDTLRLWRTVAYSEPITSTIPQKPCIDFAPQLPDLIVIPRSRPRLQLGKRRLHKTPRVSHRQRHYREMR